MGVRIGVVIFPGSTSAPVIERRAAHCEQTVIRPSARTAPRRSVSGVASGRSNTSARPGTANHAESPVSCAHSS